MELVLQADFEIFVLVSFFSVSSQYIFNHPEGGWIPLCWRQAHTNELFQVSQKLSYLNIFIKNATETWKIKRKIHTT